jgi:hypothetical protein
MISKYELKRSWKEAVVAYCKVLRHSPGGTKENHKDLSKESQSPDRDLKPGPPEYKADVLTTRPQCYISSIDYGPDLSAVRSNCTFLIQLWLLNAVKIFKIKFLWLILV